MNLNANCYMLRHIQHSLHEFYRSFAQVDHAKITEKATIYKAAAHASIIQINVSIE